MAILLDGTLGITVSGNSTLGDATTDTLNVANGNLILDASGNLGLGVSPSSWGSQVRAFESNNGVYFGAFKSSAVPNLYLGANNYFNGSTWIYSGTYAATKYEQEAGKHSWWNAPSGTAGNAITFTQAMTLDASGYLIVGGTTPYSASGGGTSVVTVEKSQANRTQLSVSNQTNNASAGAALVLAAYGADWILESGATAKSSNSLTFSYGSTERARIDSSGNLLWAKTSALETTNGIQFASDGSNIARLSIGGANSSSATSLSVYSTTASAFRFFVSYSGQINATSTSITAISDSTLKENVRDLDTGLTEVMALRPRRFDWKEETQLPDKNVAGFIAQEVEQVLPELVYDYMYSEGVTKKSLKMGDILPTLVKAIQEQQAIIESLKARLDAANL